MPEISPTTVMVAVFRIEANRAVPISQGILRQSVGTQVDRSESVTVGVGRLKPNPLLEVVDCCVEVAYRVTGKTPELKSQRMARIEPDRLIEIVK